MITNKVKINVSKTYFTVLRSPQSRCDLSGMSVNVGESQVKQSQFFFLGICYRMMLVLLLFMHLARTFPNVGMLKATKCNTCICRSSLYFPYHIYI